MRVSLLLVASFLAVLFGPGFASRSNDCEVCNKVLTEVQNRAKDKKDMYSVEESLVNYCATTSDLKEQKLCYYIEPVKRDISNPTKNGVPPDVICQRLKKKTPEVCSLRYSSDPGAPNLSSLSQDTDFSKMRVGQLKALASEMGISCNDCLEKEDYVSAIKSKLSSAKKEL